MRARLVLLCGTTFAGKSTVARALAPRLAAEIVSLDEINARRGLWGGDGMTGAEWARTHDLAAAEVRELLTTGRSALVDDTSSRRFLRDRWRALAADADARFTLLYVDVDQTTVRERRAANQLTRGRRDVSDAVFEQHLLDFEPPESDERALRLGS
ncbi:ATP-binding protein [Kribbella sandramycini]|uniref:ATP-binding protein n=1 Tax=Kribbella sandramycini TaxID=60450 RepID=A0A7Y4NX16_9ACTN|nr:AAA family ATPase [Kribbella sandramycini]MBB6567999.1 putative kinase [Kribbella sandramycini]NOL39407.1 ATP-binding protein [Kribbella sandramycini]